MSLGMDNEAVFDKAMHDKDFKQPLFLCYFTTECGSARCRALTALAFKDIPGAGSSQPPKRPAPTNGGEDSRLSKRQKKAQAKAKARAQQLAIDRGSRSHCRTAPRRHHLEARGRQGVQEAATCAPQRRHRRWCSMRQGQVQVQDFGQQAHLLRAQRRHSVQVQPVHLRCERPVRRPRPLHSQAKEGLCREQRLASHRLRATSHTMVAQGELARSRLTGQSSPPSQMRGSVRPALGEMLRGSVRLAAFPRRRTRPSAGR